ncbi:hypothetical protein [Furfurilactobacillus siliginis]|uniref:Uncharacterized protein n=1 Tax=Furfurilactobacillus siliginis TaxID=348151 RepID=A0A0R2L9R8_9LACO|nr:hypothetical protein [Furfurilactobacillus siliginis]KRN96470.1 hypothetical protein IV55_GL001442 [Furfurilactobacillus siliginis]
MTFGSLGQQILANLLAIFLYGLAIPLLFSWGLTVINRNTKQLLAGHFGINSQVYLGALGIIVHEASHLLMALLFGHKITRFRLLKFAHPENRERDPEAMTLGYVNHRWNSGDTYQTMGNFFIGFAPIVGVSALLFGLTAWLLPQTYGNILAFAQDPSWSALFHAPVSDVATGPFLAHLLLWLILVTNLSVGGFDLSAADLKNSANGLTSYVIVLSFIAVSAGVLEWSLAVWFSQHLLPVFMALLLVVVISGVVNGLVRLVIKKF